MAQRWNAVLARLGMPTGDGRLLTPGAITNRDLPLPLLYQSSTTEGHGNASVIGRIEAIEYGPDMVTATGTFLDSAPADAREQVAAGVIGPSVDLDDIEYVYDETTEMAVITKGRIAGATLVAIPAFAEVYIRMAAPEAQETPQEPVYELLAAVRTTGWGDLPIADETRDWDGDAAASRIYTWATDGDTTDWAMYARGFLLQRDDADPETRGAYGYGIADIIDGTLTIVPRGVFAAAAAVQGARSGETPEGADSMRSVLAGIYSRMDRTPPWEDSGMQAAATFAPPLDWFRNPNLDGPTPITIQDDGRVFGHVATWGTCHVGLPGCVTPPSSPSEYAYFMVGAERTAEGVDVPVGKLTVGGGHAEPGMGFRAAAEHYDNVGAAVASVFAGEDEHGIWVAGYMLPGASEEQRAELMRSPLSGDWRRIGGNLELIAAHAVNVPGFPIKRTKVKFAAGSQMSLVGNFAVKEKPEGSAPSVEPFNEARNHKARMRWISAQMRLKGR